jgi:hypothetical protein
MGSPENFLASLKCFVYGVSIVPKEVIQADITTTAGKLKTKICGCHRYVYKHFIL